MIFGCFRLGRILAVRYVDCMGFGRTALAFSQYFERPMENGADSNMLIHFWINFRGVGHKQVMFFACKFCDSTTFVKRLTSNEMLPVVVIFSVYSKYYTNPKGPLSQAYCSEMNRSVTFQKRH